MAVQYSAKILDKHIAPGVSSFTKADIPDMATWAKQSPHWIANFFLNSAFTASFAPPMNAYAYNFLRRAQYAFSEHHLARESTLAFLAAGGQSPTRYADALFHWECFLGQAWQAFALLCTAWEGRVYDKKDGSIEERLNALYNQVKHVESRINSGQMIPGATVPVWLDNYGLRSVDASLTYVETAEVLKELAKYADALMNPKTAKSALNELDA
ncbi:MAG TPA: hypothetical protein VM431_01460 [Phycisphaerae bacterium]|nr:hypothetical protein [Phycisphaerae bacterium]